jgi:excisionase family DNA binding protein
MKPIPAVSGRSPDLAVKQRSRDGAPSRGGTPGQQSRLPERASATTALDTTDAAPLPAVGTSTPISGWQLLTADDVAAILRVPRSLVYALARRAELPSVRVGDRYVRFRPETIESWMKERETTDRCGTQ